MTLCADLEHIRKEKKEFLHHNCQQVSSVFIEYLVDVTRTLGPKTIEQPLVRMKQGNWLKVQLLQSSKKHWIILPSPSTKGIGCLRIAFRLTALSLLQWCVCTEVLGVVRVQNLEGHEENRYQVWHFLFCLPLAPTPYPQSWGLNPGPLLYHWA